MGFFSLRRNREVRNEGVRLTWGGSVFLIGVLLIGLTAVDADINLLLLMFGFCAGAYIVNATYGWRALRHLRVRRVVPESVIAGQSFQIRYIVTNQHRWAIARSVVLEDIFPGRHRDETPQAFIRSLRPGESITLNVQFICRERGRIPLQAVRFFSRFPFNLVTKSVRLVAEDELIVCPAVGRMLIDPTSAARSTESSVTASTAGRSRGDEEYSGIREYRHGDSVRKIYWRRSARTGQLVIRETTQSVNKQFWCAIDTRSKRRSQAEAEALEKTMSAAATFICSALEQGASVGLICNGDPLVILPPGSGRAYRPRLMRELGLREGGHEDSLAQQIRRHPWPTRWQASCVLFSVRDDAETRDAAACLKRTLGPTRCVIANTPGFDQVVSLSGEKKNNVRRNGGGKGRSAA
ncbi:MAG: DUF58 domain-containing protein [Phycisphaerales bacterium]|nr:DUF58 domain-containing protein [Phycisphaerales bacterium]MCB9856940.1 DUF58 domain-containing protein [Phycisphaerales bacterium]MCB9861933.1 DUF58 domain-containing protein [Phycisphaerales bacterium]